MQSHLHLRCLLLICLLAFDSQAARVVLSEMTSTLDAPPRSHLMAEELIEAGFSDRVGRLIPGSGDGKRHSEDADSKRHI